MRAETNSKQLLPYIGKLCPYCHRKMTFAGKKRPTRDHFIAKFLGGKYTNNIVICCAKCNNQKGHIHVISWWVKLRNCKDPRADIVFAFIVSRIERKLMFRATRAKKKHQEQFDKLLLTWKKPVIAPIDSIINLVTRIGSDEIECSLTATWY